MMAAVVPQGRRVQLGGRRLIVRLVALGLLLVGVSGAARAHTPPRWSLALTTASDVGTSLEAQRGLIERALRVEMQDIVIRGAGEQSTERVFLLISVQREQGSVLVQVWDRGEDMGTRLVSASGPPAVWSRRIALAVSELSRELSRKREVALAKQHLAEAREKEETARAQALAARQAPRLAAAVDALFLVDHAYVVGPSVGLVLNRNFPWSVGLSLGYQMGELFALSGARPGGGAPLWSAISLGVAVDRSVLLAPSLGLSLGFDARALIAHVSGDASLDSIPGQRDSYLLLGGLHAGLAYELGRQVSLLVRLDAGPVLRPLEVEVSGQSDRVHGGYVGLSLGVRVAAP